MLRSGLKYFLEWAGVEVLRGATLHKFLNSREIDLVVDVGANLGQFAQGVRNRGYRGCIRSFEPVSTVFAALERASAGDPRWVVDRLAIGAEAGHVDINIPENHTLSSIMPMDPAGAALLDVSPVTERIERVEMTTLDRALSDDPARSIFLKIDTQGFERAVLEGGSETLRRTVGVLMELPVEHLYQGVWSLPDALLFMDALGFAPAQFRTVNPLASDPASAIEFDCLFRRKPDQRL